MLKFALWKVTLEIFVVWREGFGRIGGREANQEYRWYKLDKVMSKYQRFKGRKSTKTITHSVTVDYQMYIRMNLCKCKCQNTAWNLQVNIVTHRKAHTLTWTFYFGWEFMPFRPHSSKSVIVMESHNPQEYSVLQSKSIRVICFFVTFCSNIERAKNKAASKSSSNR